MNGKAHPTVLAFVPFDLRTSVTRALTGCSPQIAFVASIEALTAHIESGCPEVIVVDTDLVGCPVDLCRFVRSLRSDAKVVGLSCRWSDRDDALAKCLDAILHKPPRVVEWETTLNKLGFGGAGGAGATISRAE
jgi:DNA-binding response OmpR family regulator